jgi:hypothetical protein
MYTMLGKHLMLNAMKAAATHIGIFAGEALTACTASAASNTFTKPAHGLVVGQPVMLQGLSAGEGDGLFNNIPYYILSIAGNDFKLCDIPGGAEIDFGSDSPDLTVIKFTELVGGAPAYARKPVTWDNPAIGNVDNTDPNILFDIPAGNTVLAAGAFDAAVGGNMLMLDMIPPEAFGGQGIYDATDADFHLNLDRVPPS